MENLSVVIIAKNSEYTIADCINSGFLVCDDVVLIDSGSTDHTIMIAKNLHARVFSIDWPGYGAARNFGAAQAKGDYIFTLDSDEVISSKLAAAVTDAALNEDLIYSMKRVNHVGAKPVTHGEWSNDITHRIYNKHKFRWNDALVHEGLEPVTKNRKLLKGPLLHFTARTIEEYTMKLSNYARLSAQKRSKKAGWFKSSLSPSFNFFKNYILKGGFLDGKEGFGIARAHYHYTRLKYGQTKN